MPLLHRGARAGSLSDEAGDAKRVGLALGALDPDDDPIPHEDEGVPGPPQLIASELAACVLVEEDVLRPGDPVTGAAADRDVDHLAVGADHLAEEALVDPPLDLGDDRSAL